MKMSDEFATQQNKMNFEAKKFLAQLRLALSTLHGFRARPRIGDKTVPQVILMKQKLVDHLKSILRSMSMDNIKTPSGTG